MARRALDHDLSLYPRYTGTEPCTYSDNPDRDWFGLDEDEGGARWNGREIEQRRRVCATCPLLEPCMRYAVASNEPAGMWGATTHQERALLRRMEAWPVWDEEHCCWVVPMTIG